VKTLECVGGPMDGSEMNLLTDDEHLRVYHNGKEHIATPGRGPGPLLGVYRFHQGFVRDTLVWEPSS
jgi:hypothetical protein